MGEYTALTASNLTGCGSENVSAIIMAEKLLEQPLARNSNCSITEQQESTTIMAHEHQIPPTNTPSVNVVLAVCFSVVTLVTLSGNVMVWIAVMTDRKLRKLSNFFIASLASADFLVSLTIMPLAAVNHILQYWPMGLFLCKLWLAVDITCCTSSILHLCVISIDRYAHIRSPLRYNVWMNKRKFYIIVATVWISSILLSSVPLGFNWHLPPEHSTMEELWNHRHPQCILDINPYYAIISSSVSFFLPCLVMLVVYSRLYVLARRHISGVQVKPRAKIRESSLVPPTTQDGELTPMSVSGVENQTASRSTITRNLAAKQSEYKAIFTLGIITSSFIICWFPFFVCNVIVSFCEHCVPADLMNAFIWAGYVNSMLNPAIYPTFNTQFRRAFRNILLRTFVCRRFRCCRAVFGTAAAGLSNRSIAMVVDGNGASDIGNTVIGRTRLLGNREYNSRIHRRSQASMSEYSSPTRRKFPAGVATIVSSNPSPLASKDTIRNWPSPRTRIGSATDSLERRCSVAVEEEDEDLSESEDAMLQNGFDDYPLPNSIDCMPAAVILCNSSYARPSPVATPLTPLRSKLPPTQNSTTHTKTEVLPQIIVHPFTVEMMLNSPNNTYLKERYGSLL